MSIPRYSSIRNDISLIPVEGIKEIRRNELLRQLFRFASFIFFSNADMRHDNQPVSFLENQLLQSKQKQLKNCWFKKIYLKWVFDWIVWIWIMVKISIICFNQILGPRRARHCCYGFICQPRSVMELLVIVCCAFTHTSANLQNYQRKKENSKLCNPKRA